MRGARKAGLEDSTRVDAPTGYANTIATTPSGFEERAGDAQLSSAELEVCRLVICGLSNKEIARLRRRSPATIKNQVASILDKFGLPNRCHLLARLR